MPLRNGRFHFAISQYLARSRRSPSSRLRLTSQGPDEGPYFRVNWTLPALAKLAGVRDGTRDLDGAPQTTHPRAYFLTRESRLRERLHSARSAPQARGQDAGKAPRESVSDRNPLTPLNSRLTQNPDISTPLNPVRRGRQGVASVTQGPQHARHVPKVPTAGKVPRRSGNLPHFEHSRAESKSRSVQHFPAAHLAWD